MTKTLVIINVDGILYRKNCGCAFNLVSHWEENRLVDTNSTLPQQKCYVELVVPGSEVTKIQCPECYKPYKKIEKNPALTKIVKDINENIFNM